MRKCNGKETVHRQALSSNYLFLQVKRYNWDKLMKDTIVNIDRENFVIFNGKQIVLTKYFSIEIRKDM